MKRSVVRAAVMALTCAVASSTTFAAPSYPVLHQSAGNGEVDAPPGHLDRIPDLSGNDNHFWSIDAPPKLDTSLGYTEFNDGPTPPYTMNFNGGTSTMAPLVDLQRGQFYWAADIRITPNAQGAEQGGIATGNNYVFSSHGNQVGAGGEGCRLRVNADGSVSAFAEYTNPVTHISTAAGLVSDNTWVHLAVSFESAYDGGLSVGGDVVGAGRQIWGGTLRVYVNGTLQASGAASHVLNDAGYVPILGQRRHDVGISPNMAFDNIVLSGDNVMGPPRPKTFQNMKSTLVPGLQDWLTAWGDLNNDGFPELYDGNFVWINDGGTSFSKSTMIHEGGQCIFGDYDNDGLLDAFDFSSPSFRILHNVDGTKQFTQLYRTPTFGRLPTIPRFAIVEALGACWADFDNDGFIDIYCGAGNPVRQDQIIHNTRGKTFGVTWSHPLARYGRGVTACDFDEDNDMDVYVSNYWLAHNQLFLNNGSGGFTDVAGKYDAHGGAGHSIGSAWGDFDNDGHFDLFAGNFAHAGQPLSRFYRNKGPEGGYHFDYKGPSGVAWQESYASPALGDYDNDGDLDLYFTTWYGGDAGRLYRNNGNWNFANVTAAENLNGNVTSYQAAWADFDRDGDLDLVTDGKLHVNSSSENGNHWLEVHLVGDGKKINRAAIGAQVRIDMGGGIIQTRQVEAGTGQGNQNDLLLHFGLGIRTTPVDLKVTWTDGSTQLVNGVSVDQLITVQMEVDVSNGVGVTDMTDVTATLNGNLLSLGGEPTADVIIYWGPSNEGATNNWSNRVPLNDLGAGSFSTDLTGLKPATDYFYRCFATNASGATWASESEQFTTAARLPFMEPFEECSLGMLHGQAGWSSIPSTAAVVQANNAQGGSTQACDISNGLLSHAVSSSSATNIVWTDFYLKPIPSPTPGNELQAQPDATAIFFVETETRFVVVYDGFMPTTLSSKPPAPASGFVRFTVRSDYAAKTWDLWMDGVKVAENLGFFNAAKSRYASFKILDGGASKVASVVDTVNVSLIPGGGLTTMRITTTEPSTTSTSSTTAFTGLSYPVLHQSHGDGQTPEGWLVRIPDLSGNDNHLWSMDAPPKLDTSLGHTEFNNGPTPPYTMSFNGGTSTMAPTNDLQRGQFYWAADIRITPNAQGAGQGGIATGNNYVFSSYGDQIGAGGEGVRLRVDADGAVSAFAEYTNPVTHISTAPGLVSDNTWVHLAVSFESASDGGLSVGGDPVGAGRQIWDGTLNIYVNGTLKASAAAAHVLNDAGYVPTLGQQRHDLGISPNMAFDNILIKGGDLIPPDPLGTIIFIE
jgi:hypothetical protein